MYFVFLLRRVHIWFPYYAHLVKELRYLLLKLVLMSEHYLVCFSTGQDL